MIPRTIHYCWFGGGALPALAARCLASWREQMPDYEIKCWNEENFDVFSIPYTREAYRLGLYAYVSDYARLWVLYHHGGIYLDTDVELLRPLDDLIAGGDFMGEQQPEDPNDHGLHCAMGLGVGCEAGHRFIGRLLEHYRTLHFVSLTGRQGDTIVGITRRLLADEPVEELDGGLKRCAGFTIYPWPYLCPLNYFTGQLEVRDETHAIHHYAASWVTDRQQEAFLHKALRRLRGVIARMNVPPAP